MGNIGDLQKPCYDYDTTCYMKKGASEGSDDHGGYTGPSSSCVAAYLGSILRDLRPKWYSYWCRRDKASGGCFRSPNTCARGGDLVVVINAGRV